MAYLALMLFAGCLIALQAPINAALARSAGQLEASLVNFVVGCALLCVAVLFWGGGHLAAALRAPAWQWSGGVFGAVLVLGALISVPKIGALSAAVAMILGNLLMAALIDNFGWLGLAPIRLSFSRVLGLSLILSGLFFVFRR